MSSSYPIKTDFKTMILPFQSVNNVFTEGFPVPLPQLLRAKDDTSLKYNDEEISQLKCRTRSNCFIQNYIVVIVIFKKATEMASLAIRITDMAIKILQV